MASDSNCVKVSYTACICDKVVSIVCANLSSVGIYNMVCVVSAIQHVHISYKIDYEFKVATWYLQLSSHLEVDPDHVHDENG